jgi:hypothetical protein
METQPWVTNVYKPLDMSIIQGYPQNMPDKYNKWLPKFLGNNIIIAKEHISNFYYSLGEHEVPTENEDVVMKLFSFSLEENSKSWYNGLPTNDIRTWKYVHDAFIKRWGINKDGKMMLTQLHGMKKIDNKSVRDFDEIFDKLVKEFPDYFGLRDDAILFHYTNAFDGQFGFMLRYKSPNTLEIAKKNVSNIEENVLSSKEKPFNTSRASTSKSESKKWVVNTTD